MDEINENDVEVDIIEEDDDDIDPSLAKCDQKDERFLVEAKKLREKSSSIKIDKVNKHGMTVHFKDIISGKFKLPTRKNFIKEMSYGPVLKFSPLDIIEENTKHDDKYRYTLYMTGVLENGEKAIVQLNNIKVYFDLEVPFYRIGNTEKQINRILFAKRIGNLYNNTIINNRPFYFTNYDGQGKVRKIIEPPNKIEIKKFKHFKHLTEPIYYLRLYFDKLEDRKRSIEYFRDGRNFRDFTVAEMNGDEGTMIFGYKTASDDLSCHYRKVCRDYDNLKFADWGEFTNYEINETKFKCKCFSVDIENYNLTTGPSRDMMLECDFDIETYSNVYTKGVPKACYNDMNPDFTYWKWNPDTCVFMICMNFNFWHSKDYLLNVCIVDKYTAPTDNKLTIVCDTEYNIVKCFGLVFEAMMPDLLIGFNSGNYDIPYIIQTAYLIEMKKDGVFDYSRILKDGIRNDANVVSTTTATTAARTQNPDADGRIEQGTKPSENLLQFLFSKMSLTYRDFKPESALKFNYSSINIKIEATRNVDEFIIQLPGFICLDVMNIFRKIYNKSTKYSLNFFLTENKLGNKFDMPYLKLFYVYKLAALKHKLRTLDIKLEECDKETKMYYAKFLHKLSDFFEEKIEEDFTPEQISAIKALASTYTENTNDREKFYRATCEIELSLFNNFTNNQIKTMELNSLEMDYVDELMALAGEYCVIDSYSCHKLMLCRNVFQDKREMANMADCSIFDCVFRADGMKVRNMIIAEGQKRDNITFTNISNDGERQFTGKYPGAFVVDPIQGLYKPKPNMIEFWKSHCV